MQHAVWIAMCVASGFTASMGVRWHFSHGSLSRLWLLLALAGAATTWALLGLYYVVPA